MAVGRSTMTKTTNESNSAIKESYKTLCDGRKLIVDPDKICDVTALPFPDESFYLVVFDPPHLRSTAGDNQRTGQRIC